MGSQRPVVESTVARLRDIRQKIKSTRFTDEEADKIVSQAESLVDMVNRLRTDHE